MNRRLQKPPLTGIQGWRRAVQFFFLAVVVAIGIQFCLFVSQLERAAALTVTRPAGIEAFLPISSLISLKYWLVTGIFNRVHPSGLVIFVTVLASAILLKRSFCSWICPFGLLTEYLNRLHRLIFRKNVKLPVGLDYPMRSLKYLLLAFFLWAIVLGMDAGALDYFIYSPYNMVADIKMLYFFKHITPVAFTVLAALVLLSIVIRNFWCRYLCPYGALLGMLSFLSLVKIHRNEDTCTGCEQCTRSCPVDIRVHQRRIVFSDECHGCLRCVAACPENETLYMSVSRRKGIVTPAVFAAAVCLLFIAGPLAGRISGRWHTGISTAEYRFHISNLDLPLYGHNRGQVPAYNKQAWLRMMDAVRRAGSAKSPAAHRP